MEPMTLNIPAMALRGLAVFPHMTLTFDVERQISIAALERAMEADQQIFLVTQREIGVNKPEEKDLYEIGTVSHITQILRLSANSVRVMVEGRQRARMRRLWQVSPYLQAHVELIEEAPTSEAFQRSPRTEALLRQTWNLFSEYVELAGAVPEEVISTVMDCRDVGYLADFITQNIALHHTDKQEILEELAPFVRLRKLNGLLARSATCWALSGRWKVRCGMSWHRLRRTTSCAPRSGSSRTNWATTRIRTTSWPITGRRSPRWALPRTSKST